MLLKRAVNALKYHLQLYCVSVSKQEMFGDQTSSNMVTKHADVEVSGQMVETCLIKHRSNYG